MTVNGWEAIKIRYCEHVKRDVSLEAQTVYSSEHLPDQPPRILAHRCSLGISCSQDNRASCKWSGTNPAFDPFIEKG
jgi:hypothetical protein